MFQRISCRFTDLCVVAASGPSLTHAVAAACHGIPVVAVNDAWRLFPDADVLYGGDAAWWGYHGGCREFRGERWSSHGGLPSNDKLACAERHGLKLVRGSDGERFSFHPSRIHLGKNSGFQAINLAIHMLGGRGRIVLVGFDMRVADGRRHFFGDHPGEMNRASSYDRWLRAFDEAAQALPDGLEILNATPQSALRSFPEVELTQALSIKRETVHALDA